MSPDIRAAWDRFLAGHWTKEYPRFPGRYPSRDLSGLRAGERIVILTSAGPREVTASGYGWYWEAWWWSEPMPDLPTPTEAKP